MRGIRRLAILFAIASTMHWQAIAWFVGLINPLAGAYVAPYSTVALAKIGSAVSYAVATLFFCHWLARRVAKQVQTRLGG